VSTRRPDAPSPDDFDALVADEAPGMLADLSWALPPGAGSSALRDRLAERARHVPVSTLRRDEGLWFSTAPGVHRKLLFHDAHDRAVTELWRLALGAEVALDGTKGDLVAVVIEGPVRVDDVSLTRGDAIGVHATTTTLRADGMAALLIATTAAPLDGAPSVEIMRAENAPSMAMSPAVTARPLFLHREPRPDVALLTVTADGALEAHDHPETEELLCLEGTCVSHGEQLLPGDYQRTRAGAAHDATTTSTGSTILVLRRHFV
jgi:hypothetical protein